MCLLALLIKKINSNIDMVIIYVNFFVNFNQCKIKFMNKISYLIIFLATTICLSQNDKEKDSLLNLTRTSKYDTVRVDCYNKLFFSEVFSDVKVSKKYFEAMFSIAKQKKSNYAYAKAFNAKGVYFDMLGKLDSAYISYNNAIHYSKKANLLSTEGSAYNNLGLLDWNKGDFYKALKNYNKSLELFEKIENINYQGNTLSNIGLIYDEIDEPKKAEFYLKKALNIRKKANDDYGLSVSYVNLGKLYEKQGKYHIAIQNYEKAIVIKKKINDDLGIAIAKYNMSTSLMKLNKLDEALAVLNEAEKICKENEAESNIVENVYSSLCQAYLLKNDLKKAKEYSSKLYVITQKNKDLERLSVYYKIESEIALKEKNFQKAYIYFNLKDSLDKITSGLEIKKAINLYEAKYQSEKKEKQLLLAKNELIEKELLIKKKNTQFQILILISLALITIGYLIYRQQKLKNKQQEQEFQLKSAIKEIEAQNNLHEQRLSISRDLHDNIGAQLTFVISSVDNLKFGNQINDNKIVNQLTKISDFTKATIIELRDTIWAMNKDEFSFEDLRSRIFNFIEKAKIAKEGIGFEFKIDEKLAEIKLSSIVGINIYRTIQESINNAIKYSNGTKISVDVKSFHDKIQIEVKDNGNGFDIENIDFGNGLNNMKKRIEEIDGTFEINTLLNKGTIISILI